MASCAFPVSQNVATTRSLLRRRRALRIMLTTIQYTDSTENSTRVRKTTQATRSNWVIMWEKLICWNAAASFAPVAAVVS